MTRESDIFDLSQQEFTNEEVEAEYPAHMLLGVCRTCGYHAVIEPVVAGDNFTYLYSALGQKIQECQMRGHDLFVDSYTDVDLRSLVNFVQRGGSA